MPLGGILVNVPNASMTDSECKTGNTVLYIFDEVYHCLDSAGSARCTFVPIIEFQNTTFILLLHSLYTHRTFRHLRERALKSKIADAFLWKFSKLPTVKPMRYGCQPVQ